MTPQMLTEIDLLFDKAELYFNKKQQYIQQQINKANPKRYNEIKSKVNTNLVPIDQEQRMRTVDDNADLTNI